MPHYARSRPLKNPAMSARTSVRFAVLLLFCSMVAIFTPAANAQDSTIISLGSGTVDHDLVDGQRWMRINVEPLITGTHTISITWDSEADIQFSLFQILDAPSPDDKLRIATTSNTSTPGEWTGTLELSESYYLGIWSAAGAGDFVATLEAVIPEPDPLEIFSQPMDRVVTEGEAVSFNVMASGDGTLAYQWFVDSEAIAGATIDTYELPAASLADDGRVFHVQITDNNGSISSDSASLEVIAIEPPTSIVNIGQGLLDSDKNLGPRWVRIDFDALASTTHTITVSWDSDADVRFNLFHVDGTAVSSTIQGSNPGLWSGELAANEQYYMGLWSADGVADYNVWVEASVPLSFAEQPSDLIVTEGDDATFIVEAAGSGPFTYQWLLDGYPLSGETDEALTVFATTLAEDGAALSVAVSNGHETLTSDAAILTVNAPVVLGLFSQDADLSAWMLDGPAPTLDYEADAQSDAWGRVLLRIDDLLLVGGDFQGIKAVHSDTATYQPYLAAFDATSGQPVSTFDVPVEIDSVVRALALSPDGSHVYVGGDFGLLVLDAATGVLEQAIDVLDNSAQGRVFDIAVVDTALYIGGDFSKVGDSARINIARLSLDGEIDTTWSPEVTHGFAAGRSAPVQSLTVSPSGDIVYVGGNFQFINGIPVATTPASKRISMLSLSALDGSVQAERFIPDLDVDNNKGVTAHDIAVTDDYVIIAWGGPNFLTFHALSGDLLVQYRGKGDIQALQVVGNHVFVGHHGEFFQYVTNPIPAEAVESIDPEIIVPYKFHSFRIDDPSFPPEQAWKLLGTFGVWGIAAAEDAIWIAGDLRSAGLNERTVEGLVRFPALD